jgi:hypothetical protein
VSENQIRLAGVLRVTVRLMDGSGFSTDRFVPHGLDGISFGPPKRTEAAPALARTVIAFDLAAERAAAWSAVRRRGWTAAISSDRDQNWFEARAGKHLLLETGPYRRLEQLSVAASHRREARGHRPCPSLGMGPYYHP